MTIIFFTDTVEWSSKNLWKMISADVKANKNGNWFWLVFFPFWHCLLRIGAGFFAKGQNLSSMTKVICRQSVI